MFNKIPLGPVGKPKRTAEQNSQVGSARLKSNAKKPSSNSRQRQQNANESLPTSTFDNEDVNQT